MRNPFFYLVLGSVLAGPVLRAEAPEPREKPKPATVTPAAAGMVSGRIVDGSAKTPVEYATVTLQQADGTVVQRAATESEGAFTFESVPAGSYVVTFGRVGTAPQTTPAFTVDAGHRQVDLGRLGLGGDVVHLERFTVEGKQDARLNSIDRKVYNVGKDIQSTTGSAGDLLQNVPSVDVDIDGNVSLRGSDNVLILIDGHTSTLMGKSRAEVLQQLPADAIDRIEVITNPSAKFKPDGTAGIINIALKRKHDAGLSGTVSLNVGNGNRENTGLTLNLRKGSGNLFASYSLRQDDRPRTAADLRTITDPSTGAVTHAAKHTVELSRPLTRIGRLGWDYAPTEHDRFGLTGNYNYRTFTRRATDTNVIGNGTGAVSSSYLRDRFDPEFEKSQEAAATYQHTFAGEGHELNLEVKSSLTREGEPDYYTNTYLVPVSVPSHDNVIIHNTERSHEYDADYSRPLGAEGKLEAGYMRTEEHFDADFLNEAQDPASGLWIINTGRTNRFILDRTIDAFYATCSRTFGPLAVMAGLRPEIASVRSDLVTTGKIIPSDSTRLYPTLHTTWRLDDRQELQFNYSHRVRRPESDDLNPFPEYIDPFNLRAGNPYLRPEETHSLECGYSYHEDANSVTATLYHRYTYNGFTNITSDLGNGVLLTTHENLAVNRASGLELTGGWEPSKLVTFNTSANIFLNTIDASNLGYSASKSDVSWLAKFGATFHLGAATQLQLNANYSSSRLTPQGERRPTFVANAGVRHDLLKKRLSLVLTVSDVFNSLKEEYIVNTPLLQEDVTRRRSARIVYLGLIYNFGRPAKKSKEDLLKFDNSL